MPTTETIRRRTSMGACASCGAYGATPCLSTCTPGKRFQLEPSRWANPNDPTSYAFWERTRIESERRMMGDDL